MPKKIKDQIIDTKEELEAAIFTLVLNFHKETGLDIRRIHVTYPGMPEQMKIKVELNG